MARLTRPGSRGTRQRRARGDGSTGGELPGPALGEERVQLSREGDQVRNTETRPLSKTKRWRLVKVLPS